MALLGVVAFAAPAAKAGYDFAGQGVSNVLSGHVTNGNLFWSTVPAWLNNTPALPYTSEVSFTLPACDRIVASRLVLTVWGGTADYVCQMHISVNGSNPPALNPFTFGTTTDTNAVFSATQPCAYGSGFGVWLVGLPIPGELLHTNGAANIIRVGRQTPSGFDGRIHHTTLVAIYESAALANRFDYALAEGSGDIRAAPAAPQVDQRTVTFAAVNPTNATAATLTALYTYGDTGQNDMLFFNGTALGGNDVSQWYASQTNYGPSVVSFDVLANLAATNTVRFDVSAANVPEPRDQNLRPQLAALGVTRPASVPLPSLTITSVGVIAWTTNSAGFSLESNTNLLGGTWGSVTNVPDVSGDQFTVTVGQSEVQQFFRLKKSN
jgi:hypothetical protein